MPVLPRLPRATARRPININPDGSVSIDNDGVWREYLNGKVVNEYSGDTVPGTQEFDSSTIWEKQTHIIN